MMSPAGANHGGVAMTIGVLLTVHVRSNKLGKVFAAETGFVLGRNPDTVRAPDAAFVKSDRTKSIPKEGFFPGPPDLAVEVLSPGDAAGEVLEKVNDWLTAGTVEVWIVDPIRKTIAIHDKHHAPRTLKESDDLTCDSLLPGFNVSVAEVFR